MAAVENVVETLKATTRPITTKDEICQVATISANNDHAIGNLIADAMERVGKEGVITVQDGRTVEDQLEVVEGMKFDRGYISPYFVTDPKTQKVEFESPMIMLVDGKVSSIQSIVPILESVFKASRPLIIIAEDIDGEALATLVLNKLRGSAKVAAVKAPGFGENRKANLQDLAILVGGQLISEEVGLKLEDATLDMLGTCKKITISKDDTIILDGAGSRADIEERCELLRASVSATSSDYEKEKLQERLAKLSGGVAVIKVGGSSEVEVGEKKDRVDDALNATRAAVEEGIVPGGGMALLYATMGLKNVVCANRDQEVGVDIVRRALQVPAKAIIENAGLEGSVVVGRLLEDAKGDMKCSRGMNSYTGEYCDMVATGIIDPTKVVSHSFLASLLLSFPLLSSLQRCTHARTQTRIKTTRAHTHICIHVLRLCAPLWWTPPVSPPS
jgi:chaperonin GroEL